MTHAPLARAKRAWIPYDRVGSWPHGYQSELMRHKGGAGATSKNRCAPGTKSRSCWMSTMIMSITYAPKRRPKSTRSTGFASGSTNAAASPFSPPASKSAASRSSRATSLLPAAVARASPAAWRWLISSYVMPARSASPSGWRARMRRTVESSHVRASVVICMVSFSFQQPRNRAGVLLPFLHEHRPVLPAATGDAVVFPRGHAGLDLAPGARDVALRLERVERRVDVPLCDL